MRKHFLLLSLSLLLGLFIYLFFRTERTLVNQLILILLPGRDYQTLRQLIREDIQLPSWAIYSLPEGLWIFCITLCSRFFYLRIREMKLELYWLPLIIAVVMEVFQFYHFSGGRFDPVDLLTAFFFWMLALSINRGIIYKEELLSPLNRRKVFCLFNYAIVYMAHVMK